MKSPKNCSNCSGSAAVLFTVLFAGILTLVAVLFSAAQLSASNSLADAALRTGARAVLSEYDLDLYDRYSLMAFISDEKRIEGDLGFYTGAELSKSKIRYALFRNSKKCLDVLSAEPEITANLKKHSLLDLDTFERQVNSAAPLMIIKKTYKDKNHTAHKSGSNGQMDPDDAKKRTLRKSSIINSLPSDGYSSSFFSSISLPDWGDVMDDTKSAFKINEYVMSTFGRANDGLYRDDRFYDREIEYILEGHKSESANYTAVIAKIFVAREVANAAHILADKVKMVEVHAVAAAASAWTAEIGEPLAVALIVAAWTTAETKNDIALLEQGRNVAVIKTKAQWATDNVAEIFDGILPTDAVLPEVSSGVDYNGYLRMMLYLENRETKLLRMMDLIQIDMKAHSDKDFMIRKCYAGFEYTATNGKRSVDYEEVY
jgi:hypothetical protein